MTTTASVSALIRKGYIDGLLDGVQLLILDEMHHAGAKSYTDLLIHAEHIYHRFGFTGTFTRNDEKTLELWSVLSNVVYRYPAHQGMEDGFLTPVQLQLHNVRGYPRKNYHKEYKINYCENEDLFLRVVEICKTHQNEQILILIKLKSIVGGALSKILQFNGVDHRYICGDNSADEIFESINDFNNHNTRVLIGSSVIGEGIDVQSADHLIMLQGGKSNIAVSQAVGRLVRIHEGKKIGTIHDFSFGGTKYMEKHIWASELEFTEIVSV